MRRSAESLQQSCSSGSCHLGLEGILGGVGGLRILAVSTWDRNCYEHLLQFMSQVLFLRNSSETALMAETGLNQEPLETGSSELCLLQCACSRARNCLRLCSYT